MRVLVTGADGFVGRHLVARLVETGHEVTAACRPGGEPVQSWLDARYHEAVGLVPFELTDSAAVKAAVNGPCDAIVHLAAIATVTEARLDPGRAWLINAGGTASLVDAVIARRDASEADPLVLVVSSAEVYGRGPASPRTENDRVCPQSTYAATKAGVELAALEAWRRAGARVVIARPFQHIGPGQPLRYVVPSFIQRLRAAKTSGATRVPTGNLDPVRDLLDVRDVTEAYLGLLAHGTPGEVYNIARGEGVTLRQVFHMLADLIGVQADPVTDPALARAGDIPYLVGDATKLRAASGWSPTIPLEQTLRNMVNAEAH
ncbi:MAG TPA: GDP-mannose 4,6-dehydratase [Gemmatimonadales bacterium]|jgi:GDP-4-dehydro-6-deoxy-D-mannose reductase